MFNQNTNPSIQMANSSPCTFRWPVWEKDHATIMARIRATLPGEICFIEVPPKFLTVELTMRTIMVPPESIVLTAKWQDTPGAETILDEARRLGTCVVVFEPGSGTGTSSRRRSQPPSANAFVFVAGASARHRGQSGKVVSLEWPPSSLSDPNLSRFLLQ